MSCPPLASLLPFTLVVGIWAMQDDVDVVSEPTLHTILLWGSLAALASHHADLIMTLYALLSTSGKI